MSELLAFTVENYRSIRSRRTIHLSAQSIKDGPMENVVELGRVKFLTSAAIYGANSSGKSNFIMAFGLMKSMVIGSVKLNDNDELPYEPFALSKVSINQPTFFEIIYQDGINRFRYNFSYNKKQILFESLYCHDGRGEEKLLFARDNEGIGIDERLFPEGNGLEERTNENRLFLSVVSQLGGTISRRVLTFFQSGYNVISGLNSYGYSGITETFFHKHSTEAKEALDFFHDLKLGFDSIGTEEREIPNEFLKGLPIADQMRYSKEKQIKVFSSHNVYDDHGAVVDKQWVDFTEWESQGTLKLFELAGPIFDTLKNGQLLVVDELDAKMHPLISQHIIRLFNSRTHNPKHAQLIFSTHDTNLLAAKLLRRDQIWFTEKDSQEDTDLYNMMDIVLPDGSKPRSDANLERNYIRGRYGAVPYLNELMWYEEKKS